MNKHTLAALTIAASAAFASSASAADKPSWRKIKLSDQFHCEGASFADFNKDGKVDVVSGPWWWEGPDFKTKHEIYKPTGKQEGGSYKPDNDYSDNFFAFTHDFNADSYPDYLVLGFPGKEARLYINPKGKDEAWPVHHVFDVVDNESPTFGDFTGDGKPEIIFHSSGAMAALPAEGKNGALGIAQPDWSDPTKPWKFTRMSPRREYYQKFTHGFGWGDVNGDGKNDLLDPRGWWENTGSAGAEFKEHPYPFGAPGGSQMYVYDVDGDGLSDVVASLAAHGWGLAWFKQKKADGKITFDRQIIMDPKGAANEQGVRFSQLHALELTDMNGDGLKDIVTGKRYFAHGSKGDAEPTAPAVLYWFELKRNPDKTVQWIGHEIDNDSGVGTQVVTGHINGDKTPDIVVGNKKGTFVFLSQ